MKTSWMNIALAIGLLGSAPTVVQAGELSTPFVPALSSVDYVACFFTNISSSDMYGTIRLIGDTGITLHQSGNLTLSAGTTSALNTSGVNGGRCVFSFSGSKKQVRAHVCVVNGNTLGTCQASTKAE